MRCRVLTLEFRDDGGAHGDLLLHFGETTKVCDSYFFMLDNGLRPDDESPEKTRKVVAALLRQWSADLRALEPGATAYLPFDFSDQYSGWIRAELGDGDGLDLALVWTATRGFEGWAFNPSDYKRQLRRHTAAWQSEPDQPTLRAARPDVLAGIDTSLRSL